MTVEEIKATYSMHDIIQMYGIQASRAGFIHCPFHQGDRTASCKIYHKDFHCHACGANGDIFTFVEKMENCSFKEAFRKLGGTYEKTSDDRRALFLYRKKNERERRLREEDRLRAEKRELFRKLRAYEALKESMEPECVFSELWCRAVEWIFHVEIRIGEINEKLRGGGNVSG